MRDDVRRKIMTRLSDPSFRKMTFMCLIGALIVLGALLATRDASGPMTGEEVTAAAATATESPVPGAPALKTDAPPPQPLSPAVNRIVIFYETDCPRCDSALSYLERIQPKYEDLKVIRHNINDPDNLERLVHTAAQFGIERDSLSVPVIIVNGHLIRNFASADATAPRIERRLELSPRQARSTDTPPASSRYIPQVGE